MTLLDRIKETLGGSDSEQLFNYHCRECGTEFESTDSSRTSVECPNCGASGARAISKF